MENLSDKEQIDMLKKWWHDYGKSILMAVIIGVGIGYGWRYYKTEKSVYLQEASAAYQKMGQAYTMRVLKVANAEAGTLIHRYPETVYATMAQFMLAKEAVDKKDFKMAVESLDWVLAHTDAAFFQNLARVRKARILVQEGKKEAALSLLSQVRDAGFSAVISDLKKNINMKT